MTREDCSLKWEGKITEWVFFGRGSKADKA